MAPDAVVALLEQALHFSRQMLVAAERDAWPEFLERIVCWLVRWELIVKRGLAADQDMQQYNPEQRTAGLMGWSAISWLQAAQRGDFQDDPQFGKAGKARVFPQVVKPSAPFGGRMWRA